MKITKELKDKIYRCFKEEQGLISKEYDDKLNDGMRSVKANIVKDLEKLNKDSLIFLLLQLSVRQYGVKIETVTIEEIAEKYALRIYDIDNDGKRNAMLVEKQKKIEESRLKMEKFLIEISYGKNFDDIKALFEKYGITY